MMKGTLPDMGFLFDTLLTDGAPEGVFVGGDVNSTSDSEVPMVMWTAINNGQYDYGLWSVTLAMTVICDPWERSDLLNHLYGLVHSWGFPGKGTLPEYKYGVNSVEDQSVFNLTTEVVLNGKELLQFNATFQLTVKDHS